MSPDPKYIASSDLELFLVDKATGLALSGGIVTFYSDLNRAIKKPVYRISGNPPNYSFVELVNPSTLSGSGTFEDGSGNNVVPYYYPYDVDGNLELYYITVESATNVPQFTREAWPPEAAQAGGGSVEANAVNYIPNGQFLAHNDIPADLLNNIPAGEITESVTQIAQGGWTFVRPDTSTATDNVQFFRYGEFVSNPSASPRYAVQIVCSTPNAPDAYKDLRVRFYDVNKFSSDTEQYTFSFSASTFNSGNFNVKFNVIKNFGTGGSPSSTTVTTITQFTITATENLFQVPFVFGSNEGNSIGTNNDDYLEIAISFPTNITFGAQLTDFILFFGDVTILEFPPTTNRDFFSRSFTPPTPNSNGSNLYLPIVLTADGYGYDSSDVGTVIAAQYDFTGSISQISNLLKADGNQYFTAGYSPLGIPYSRLQTIYYNTNLNQPIFGTGKNFVSTYIQASSASNLFLSTNQFGGATAPADGTIPTGFVFFPVCLANASGFGLRAYLSGSTILTAVAITAGSVVEPAAGTSGFTINVYKDPSSVSAYLTFTITTTVATALAGKYFTFETLPGPISYYMWFKVDGSGSDPAPGGTGIEVELKSTYTAADVCNAVTKALAGCEVYVITTTAASTLAGGEYFTFGATNSNNYFVWYTVNSVGTKPTILGSYGIEVDLASGDTAAQVANKTMIAINKTYFATPMLQGTFLRGYDPNATWDLDAATRFGFCPSIYGNMIGTFEIDQVISHSHVFVAVNSPNAKPAGSGTAPFVGTGNALTSEYGGSETRPINAYVNWLIRY